MRQAEPVIEESGSVEDVHHLRLMALLHELVREKGNRGAASALGIDPRTVASCTKTGRLSWRVREALEQGLQSGASSAAARQRERNDALERRLEELEGKLRSGLEEVRAAVVGEVEALREEQAQGMRRLAQSETGQDARDGAKAALAAVEQPVVQARVEAAPRVGDPGAGTGRGAGVRRRDAGDRRVAAAGQGRVRGGEEPAGQGRRQEARVGAGDRHHRMQVGQGKSLSPTARPASSMPRTWVDDGWKAVEVEPEPWSSRRTGTGPAAQRWCGRT